METVFQEKQTQKYWDDKIIREKLQRKIQWLCLKKGQMNVSKMKERKRAEKKGTTTEISWAKLRPIVSVRGVSGKGSQKNIWRHIWQNFFRPNENINL